MPSPTTVVNGIRANWGVSDCGQLMGTTAEAGLASIEPEGTYEHLAIGVLEEGYTLAYMTGAVDNVKFDVYGSSNGINCVSNGICRDNGDEFVKVTESVTDDGFITIRQTFIISKNETRVVIRMDISNCAKRDLDDFLVKRYADIDVDTGGTAGWANFRGRWDKNRDSVFTYNLDGDAPEKKRGHVVNMVAMPSDLPLEGTYVGQLGAQQYASRANPNLLSPLPTPAPTDGDGILQWTAPHFRAGECFTINMYYDAFRSFAK